MGGKLFFSWFLSRAALFLAILVILKVVFLIYNAEAFPGLSFLIGLKAVVYGLRFDLSALAMIMALVVAVGAVLLLLNRPPSELKYLDWLLVSVSLPIWMLMLADMVYFPFSQSHLTAEVHAFTFDLGHLAITYLLTYWYWFVGLAAIVTLVLKALKRLRRPKNKTSAEPIWKRLSWVIAVIFITIIALRGGLSNKPISPIQAAGPMGAEWAPVVNNAAFNYLSTLFRTSSEPLVFFEKKELTGIYNPWKTHLNHSLFTDTLQSAPNIVLIIIESLSPEYMGCYEAPVSSTPFLDSLSQHSLVFEQMYSNGLRSIDGIPAILAGLPSVTGGSYINSPYQSNRLTGVGTILADKGYETAFFHGGNNGTFNFDQFSVMAGFKSYYGRNEFGDDAQFDGNWGIWDGPFFQFTKAEIDKMTPPFGTVLYSISNHHPFALPEGTESKYDLEGPEYLRTVRYTDDMLRHFFAQAERSSWYRNTIFIITNDHKGPTEGPNSYLTPGRYRSPLLVYHPAHPEGKRIATLAQHADILPTVADIIGCQEPIMALGQNLADTASYRFVCHRWNDIYQIMDSQFILEYRFDEGSELFKYDPSGRKNKWPFEDPVQKQKMERLLLAYLQHFDTALHENTLSR
jgi:phosphoglycerol transferase MdoB-like AlkP superfamily enzyme